MATVGMLDVVVCDKTAFPETLLQQLCRWFVFETSVNSECSNQLRSVVLTGVRARRKVRNSCL